jgi:hypothetical protein
MEAFFNTSFADVRVHVGHEAPSIGALAFTHGTDLYFAPGQYNPQSTPGQQLLGHELTHVLQQRAGRVRNPLGVGIAVVQDPALEAEAERMGLRAASAVAPIQGKLAGRGPIVAPLQAAGLRPNTVATSGAILPPATTAKDSVQRKPGSVLPRKPPVSGSRVPGILSPFGAIQRMMTQEEYVAELSNPGTKWIVDRMALGMPGRAKTLAGGYPSANTANRQSGFDAEAVKFIGDNHLTEAEVLALKIYSREEYEIINSVMQNRIADLESSNLVKLLRLRLTQRKDEHGNIVGGPYTKEEVDVLLPAMVRLVATQHRTIIEAALRKLPRTKTIAYRGARFTEAEFQAVASSKSYTPRQFYSVSSDIDVGKRFAGDPPGDYAGKPVSVLFILHLESARDISAISEKSDEKELLLLPGTTLYRVGDAEEVPEGSWNAPNAEHWYIMTQAERQGTKTKPGTKAKKAVKAAAKAEKRALARG